MTTNLSPENNRPAIDPNKVRLSGAYALRSKANGEYRLISPQDSREGSDDHTRFTADIDDAAIIDGDDAPDALWIDERALELVAYP